MAMTKQVVRQVEFCSIGYNPGEQCMVCQQWVPLLSTSVCDGCSEPVCHSCLARHESECE